MFLTQWSLISNLEETRHVECRHGVQTHPVWHVKGACPRRRTQARASSHCKKLWGQRTEHEQRVYSLDWGARGQLFQFSEAPFIFSFAHGDSNT